MLVNFWNKCELIDSICSMYGITEADILDCIESLNTEEYAVVTFCRKTGKRLDKIEYKNVSFIGKVVTTVVDDFQSIKEYGLIGLIDLLNNNTSIRNHLEECNVKIIPGKNTLIYKGVPYPINRNNKKKIGMNLTNAVDNLYSKLYCDKGSIEMFLYASGQAMRNYSTVFCFPEIFLTIDEVIHQYAHENSFIIDRWEEKATPYILSFEVPFDDLTYVTDFDKMEFFCSSLFKDDTDFLAEHYEEIDAVPECTWFNIWLLDCKRQRKS